MDRLYSLYLWQLAALLCSAISLCSCSTKVRLYQQQPIAAKVQNADNKTIATAWAKLQSGDLDESVATQYNSELRKLVAKLHGQDGPPNLTAIDTSQIHGADRIDQLLIADTIKVQRGFCDKSSIPGVGIPVALRLQPTASDPLVPEDGLWVPATVVSDGVNLRLIDSTSRSAIGVRQTPLAMNFVAPLAKDIHARQREFQRLTAVLNYERFSPRMGIVRVFGFHPKKTPVVLVHGIYSTTNSWNNAINSLMRIPEVREQYEFWVFNYPTGAPIPFLAEELRSAVQQVTQSRAALGAEREGMVLIGHSMGGLMAKALTQNSGQKQWQAYFKVAPESLPISRSQQAELRAMFFFEPLPEVERAIFVATPHRGAGITGRRSVELIDEVVRTPRDLLEATKVLRKHPELLTTEGLHLVADFPNSIEHMRPGNSLGELFSELPLNPKVKYHSIIGKCDKIVERSSSSIDGVTSEAIIESDHGAQASVTGIEEIARILQAHTTSKAN